MTIKEVEGLTGLTRSNIRYYEKEGLIEPGRNESNGYRQYSQVDVDNIKKIAYLRTLGISVEEVREIASGRLPLTDAVKRQAKTLDSKLAEMELARKACERILSQGGVSYGQLDVEQLVESLSKHWKQNKKLFRLDTAGFFTVWGGMAVWALLAAACMAAALISFSTLPGEIPIQWNSQGASSFVDKRFIFAYPAACAAVRFLLRPFIWRWLRLRFRCEDLLADYIANYLCFVIFTIELFTLLFVNGLITSLVPLLSADAAVLLILLWLARTRLAPGYGKK